MKAIALLAAACATAVLGEPEEVKPRALVTIETAPGETRQITEEERWDLLSGGGCGSHFFDITAYNAEPIALKAHAAYPSKFKYNKDIKKLFPQLKWNNIKKNLEHYSTYHTRFSETQTGAEAAEWLLEQVQGVVKKSKKSGVTAEAFTHAAWPQKSVIVTIPGRSNRTVIVGAHLDSVNSRDRMNGRAPGVDDNGTGSFTILEALRVFLSEKNVKAGKIPNTIEFHWYAAEEGGLRGSQDIFTQYAAASRDVWAMLNQDMTGYSKGTIDAGKPESFGLITDFTDPTLNEYISRVIEEYTDITYVESQCGYACSDHGSANRNGYPSSFVFEAAFEYRNPHIHTANDTIEHIDPDHVLQHAQLVLGYLYELGFSKE
ncbi:Zn-dependent exopeptidase [Corynespora cassiicola Philippines]|uniref:Peptide hydrolase n=1 Tax=Corynespora cassiicola Philippines TaxID=1448308 RepID=A0A2T2N2C3_CORCC|nr:Zn-dependent exopeptidase [Corynespora cassiicola Philippines]